MKVLLIALFIVLFASCQKDRLHMVKYEIESKNVDMEYKFHDNDNYTPYHQPYDTTIFFYDNDQYTEVFYIYYHVTFHPDVRGSAIVRISHDGMIEDEFVMDTIKCYDKYGFVKFLLK